MKALLLIVCIGHTAAQPRAGTEKNFANRGKKLLEMNRFSEAIEVLTAALQQRKNDPGVLFDRGIALLHSGKISVALADFSAVNRISPGNSQAWCYAGACLRKLQKCNQAIVAFDKALELQPSSPVVLMERGYCYYDMKIYRLAEKDYAEVCRAEPENVGAWYSLSLARQQLGNLSGALEAVGTALKLDKSNSDYHLHRGYLLKELGEAVLSAFDARPCDSTSLAEGKKNPKSERIILGKYSSVAAEATAASISSSNKLNAMQLRGHTYLQMGEYAKAVTDFTRVLAISPNESQALYYRALARKHRKEYSKALGDISRALLIKPQLPEYLLLRGMVLMESGRGQEALAIFDRLLAVDSLGVPARFNRATALLAMDSNRSAIGELTTLLHRNPEIADAWHQRGVAFLRLADITAAVRKPRLDTIRYRSEKGVDEQIRSRSDRDTGLIHRAIGDFTSCLRLKCHDADAYAARASCYNILDQYTDGLADARRAIHSDAKHLNGWIEAGLAWYGLGQIADMTAAFRTAARLAPDNPVVRFNLGFAIFNTLDSLYHADNGRTPRLDSLAKQAKIEFAAALKLDPTSSDTRVMLGVSYYFARKYKECFQYFPAESVNPVGMYYRALALAEYGDIDAAITALREYLSVGQRREYRNNAASLLEMLLRQ